MKAKGVFVLILFMISTTAGASDWERRISATRLSLFSKAKNLRELTQAKAAVTRWEALLTRCRLEEKLNYPPLGCIDLNRFETQAGVISAASGKRAEENLERYCESWKMKGEATDQIRGWLKVVGPSKCLKRVSQALQESIYKEEDSISYGREFVTSRLSNEEKKREFSKSITGQASR